MSSFTLPLIVKHLDGRRWELMKEFSYHIGSEESKEVILVPKGFITDFASIPRLFWSIIGHPTGRYGKSAVIHDFLYATQTTTRRRADKIFLEAMKVLKVSWWRRRAMWIAVRSWAWIPWNHHQKKLKKKEEE